MDSGFKTINAKTTRRICADHGTHIIELIDDEYDGQAQEWYEVRKVRAWLGY